MKIKSLVITNQTKTKSLNKRVIIMSTENIVLSDFISYASTENGINHELVDAVIDFIGEHELIDLAEEVAGSDMPSGYSYAYSPTDFFEENKALILTHLENIESLGSILIDGISTEVSLDKHKVLVQKEKSKVTDAAELVNYNQFANAVSVAVLTDVADAMYNFIQM